MNELIANLTNDGISILFIDSVHSSIEIRLSRGRSYNYHHMSRKEFTNSVTVETVIRKLADKLVRFEQEKGS